MVRLLGEKVRAGLKIRGIPTSQHTKELATSLGIPLITLADCQQIDVTIDGADEVNPQLQLIKGGWRRAAPREDYRLSYSPACHRG